MQRLSYLSHLLLPLSFGCLGVSIVVRLNQDKVVGLRVDDKLPGSVLQWEGHLVENGSQLLQSQNSKGEREKKTNYKIQIITHQSYLFPL